MRFSTQTLRAAVALALVFAAAGCKDEPVASGSTTGLDVANDSDELNRDLGTPDPGGADGTDVPGDPAESDAALDSAGDTSSGDLPVGADLSDDGASDDGAVEDVTADAPPDDSGGFDVDPGQLVDLDLEIASEGGFTGWGTRDYAYHDGTLAIHYPYLEPTDCSADLTEEQITALYAAAGAVDWDAVESSYWPPENPTCCCDQFNYALTVQATYVNANPIDVAAAWCDQSVMEELLPEDLVALLQLLDTYGTEIIEACTGT